MPRDEGFAIADMATGKLDDPKFRRLWRHVHDEAAMNAAVVLHEAIVLASWAAGERVSAEDAAPFWFTDIAAAAAALMHVGLLDADGLLPAHAWTSWYGPAYERREQRREAGRLGGRSSHGGDGSSGGEAPPKQPSSGAQASVNPSVPSVPTVRSEPSSPGSAQAHLERPRDGLEPIDENDLAYLRNMVAMAPTEELRKRYSALLEKKEAAVVH